jgi:DNA-binding transcriptional ArsR family regulator
MRRSGWTVFSTHGLVLLHVAGSPAAPVRAIAADLGISPRQVNKVLNDLEDAGLMTRRRVGRGNRYALHPSAGLRHAHLAGLNVGHLVELLDRRPRTS